jgi:myo-inositol-1(or 4)-monophosphatase
MFQPTQELSTMIDSARIAGAGLMRRLQARKDLEIRVKRRADFVTAADLESERTLRDRLLGAYPTFGMLAEESAPTPSTGSTDGADRFIVDPLDGTTNFLHGIPHFAIAIALERAGQVVAGLVYDPPKDEMFAADLGRGAWLLAGHARGQGTTERLAVSEDRDFSRAVVATGVPHAGSKIAHEAYLPMLASVMREAAGIRRMAAAALDLAYVASGRVAAFFEFGLSPWDLAAGALLVHEAAGKVTEPGGGAAFLERGNVLATNGRLHAPMLDLLRAPAPSSTR